MVHQYKNNGYNIVLDVCSGAVHVVDDLTWDIISLFEDHTFDEIRDSLVYPVDEIREAGLFKGEAPILSPQGSRVKLEDGRELLCMCANNYLGLGDNARLIEAAKRTYDERGYGVASVRFICGTQDIHKQLEKKLSADIQQILGIKAKISLVEPKSIPRSEGKAVRVIDKRKLV